MRRQGVRSAATAASNAVARENLAAGNPKYHAGETPIEQEAALKVIEPSSAQQLQELIKMIDLMYLDAGPDQRRALDFYKGQISVDGATNAVKMRFLRRFYFWLLGRGTNEDHAKTMWGRGNVAVYNAEVAAYIEQFVEKRLQYALQLSLLAQRIPVSLNGYYLYFKYIVNGELRRSKGADNIEFWDLSNDDFLRDFEVMAQYFDFGNKGSHGYADLIKPAATRPSDRAPFGAKGSPFAKVRGSTEPYPAGWENEGDENDENDDHLENNRNFLLKAASGVAKNYGFDGSDRRQPPPETPVVAKDKDKEEDEEEDDGTEDAEDVAAVTGGNKQQIEELSRTLQEAMKREVTASTAAAHESLLQKLQQHQHATHIQTQLDELKKMSTVSTKKLEAQLTKSDLADLNEGIREIRVNVAAVQRGGGDDSKLEQTNKMLQNLEAQRDRALQEKQKLEGHTAELHKRLQEAQEESARKAMVDGKHVAKIDELKRKLEDADADKIELEHELQEVAKKAAKDAEDAAQTHSRSTLESEMRQQEISRLQAELAKNRQDAETRENEFKSVIKQGKKTLENANRVADIKTLETEEAQEARQRAQLEVEQTNAKAREVYEKAREVSDAAEAQKAILQADFDNKKADMDRKYLELLAVEKEKLFVQAGQQFAQQVAQETARETAHLQAKIIGLEAVVKELGGRVGTVIFAEVQRIAYQKMAADESANAAARTAQAQAENALVSDQEMQAATDRFDTMFIEVLNMINQNPHLTMNEKANRTTQINAKRKDFMKLFDTGIVRGMAAKQANAKLEQLKTVFERDIMSVAKK